MAEPEFLGIGISTIANIGVAIGTGLLALITYMAVRVSQNQAILNQKEKERPTVHEFINTHLNPILDDLSNDMQIIERNEINWYPDYPIMYRDYGTLVFPVSERKNFHTHLSYSSFPFFLYSNKTFRQHTNLISDRLKYRRGTYVLIGQKLEQIHKELCESAFEELIKTGISTGPDILDYFSIDIEPNSGAEEETFTSKMFTRTIHSGITRQTLIDEVKTMIVLALFESHDNRDFRVGKKNYIFPIPEAVDKVKSLITKLDNREVFRLKHEIENELYDLKITDTVILESISDTKRILQERYLFTDKEMNQYFFQ
jgi:hypothetical protein